MSKVPLLSVSSIDNSLINNVNSNSTTITSAFDNTLSRNGQSPNQMQSTLDMNSNPIINVPFATMNNSPVVLGQLTNNTSPIQQLTGDVTGSISLPSGVINTTLQPVTNAKLATMAANSIKGNPSNGVGTPQDVTPLNSRSANLLNIESVNGSVGDANYTMAVTDRVILNFTLLTAPRTFTLINTGINPGHVLYIFYTGITGTNTITIVGPSSNSIIFNGNNIATTLTFPQSPGFSTACSIQLVYLGGGSWFLSNIDVFGSTINGPVTASGGGTLNFLRADGTWQVPPGTPTTSVPTFQTFTSGSNATYTPTAGMVYIKVRMIGGGGGGGAAATNAGSTGGQSAFGAWTANGGGGGGISGGSNAGAGGAGGTGGSNSTGTQIARFTGTTGGVGSTANNDFGGPGGNGVFGGGATPPQTPGAGNAAATNSGSGGSGGTQSGTGVGGGGGSGEYVEFIMTAAQVGASKTYTVGSGGGGGAAGTQAGGNGAAGIIIVEEYPF